MGFYLRLCLLFILFSSYSKAFAQDTTALPWYQYVTLKGLLIGSTTYNFDRPTSRANQFRVYDLDAGSLELDLLALSLRHDPARGTAGFRADLDMGPHIPVVDRAQGLEMGKLDLRQAFLSYLAPVGRGLKIDVGKIVTPCGYELIEGVDAVSDNASHSYLFGFALPFTHTGIRLTYPILDQLALTGMLVNGWDNVIDNNTAKTLCFQATWSPSGTTSIALSGLFGPEKNANNSDQREVLDLAASAPINNWLMLGLSADYGQEQNDFMPGPIIDTLGDREPVLATVNWRGVAGYATIVLSNALRVAIRGEVFDDPSGIRSGIAQTLHEYTVTPIWKLTPNLTLKGDLRYDLSSVPAFDRAGSRAFYQTTASLNMLYDF